MICSGARRSLRQRPVHREMLVELVHRALTDAAQQAGELGGDHGHRGLQEAETRGARGGWEEERTGSSSP